jgi:hypothetical protein
MFCPNCGKPASGNFCSFCGAKLPSMPQSPTPTIPTTPASSQDWANEIDYETLLGNPEVHDLLARQIPPAKTLSGEDLTDAGSKLLKTAVPAVPLMTVTHDLYVHLGVKSGKSREQTFPAPVGEVLVAITCSLIRSGNPVRSVQQASDGCILICDIPSGMFSLEGDLIITVTREPSQTRVSAATRVSGQLYDWGLSNRILNRLFTDLATPLPHPSAK